jgi:hypothetical protein
VKKTLFFLLLCLCPLLHAQNSQSVVLSWNAPVTTGYTGPCLTTGQINCLIGYVIADITTPSVPVVYPTVPYAIETYQVPNFPYYGTHTYSLTVKAIDFKGASQSSSPVTFTLGVPAVILFNTTGATQFLNPVP